jgi:hypothetical protein
MYVRRKAVESTYRGVMKAAIAEALTRQVWSRLQVQHQMDVSVRAKEGVSSAIETTDRELYVFGYCQRRLAFLVQDQTLFREIEKVGYKDLSSKFVVFYDKRPNSEGSSTFMRVMMVGTASFSRMDWGNLRSIT